MPKIPDSLDALRISDFRLILAGRLFVTLAVQIQGIAIGWQIYALTKDPLSLGLIGLSEALPAIAIGLYAGHIADMLDRRKIALWSVITLAASMALLVVSSASIKEIGTLKLIMFAIIAITGLARGFYGPSVFGLVGDIVPRELYGNASAWNSTVWQCSAVAGPIIGGLLYAPLGPTATYALSTGLLMASVVCFFFVKCKTVHAKKEDESIMANIAEGLKFVFSSEIILGAMAMDLFAVLFGGVVALLPIFTSEVFHTGPHTLGLLRAAPSVGAVISAAVLTQRPISYKTGAIFMWVVAGFGICMILFGLSTNVWWSLFLLMLSGVLDGISVWVRSTIYQLMTPSHMKGRFAAVNQMFIGSSNEIGEFESGVAAKFLGLVPSVLFGGCMTLLVVAVTSMKVPKLRKLEMHSLYHETKVEPA